MTNQSKLRTSSTCKEVSKESQSPTLKWARKGKVTQVFIYIVYIQLTAARFIEVYRDMRRLISTLLDQYRSQESISRDTTSVVSIQRGLTNTYDEDPATYP